MQKKRHAEKKLLSFYEVTCLEGLERFVQRELRRRFAKQHKLSEIRTPGEILFTLGGDWHALLELETAHDAFCVLPFDLPNPRSLLDPLNLRRITDATAAIQNAHKKTPLKTFRFSAAGKDTRDLSRIRATFAEKTGLSEDHEDGQLLVRLRRSKLNPQGWDLMLRISPMPLHLRRWRRIDYRGALGAPIARAMVEMLNLSDDQILLDPMCGSGTLAIEQQRLKRLKQVLAFDHSCDAVKAAKKNCASSSEFSSIQLVQADAARLPIANERIDAIVVNPPWDETHQIRKEPAAYYSLLLKEWRRVLKRGGRICIVVQAVEALEKAILEHQSIFKLIERHAVLQRAGYHPTIVMIEKIS